MPSNPPPAANTTGKRASFTVYCRNRLLALCMNLTQNNLRKKYSIYTSTHKIIVCVSLTLQLKSMASSRDIASCIGLYMRLCSVNPQIITLHSVGTTSRQLYPHCITYCSGQTLTVAIPHGFYGWTHFINANLMHFGSLYDCG